MTKRGFTNFHCSRKELFDFDAMVMAMTNNKLNTFARQFHNTHWKNKHYNQPVPLEIAFKTGIIRREREKRGLIKKRKSVDDITSSPEWIAKRKKWIRFWKKWAIENGKDYNAPKSGIDFNVEKRK